MKHLQKYGKNLISILAWEYLIQYPAKRNTAADLRMREFLENNYFCRTQIFFPFRPA
jgi:hypothetical protein